MKYRLFTGLFLLCLGLLLLGCKTDAREARSEHREVIVFAAASLAEAFTEIADEFELKYPSTTVILNFAGSQQLAHQLSQGAPADVFASANTRQMDAAIETGRVSDGSQQTFARNSLVVIFPSDNPGNLHTLSDLARPGLRLIVAAPEVPVGFYTQSFLLQATGDDSLGSSFRNGVIDNIVSYEENVRAVLSKISLGEADGGVVYTSDLQGNTANQVDSLAIPAELNMIAAYPIASINNSSEAELAQLFINFALSSQGQYLLSEFCFLPGETPE